MCFQDQRLQRWARRQDRYPDVPTLRSDVRQRVFSAQRSFANVHPHPAFWADDIQSAKLAHTYLPIMTGAVLLGAT
jgi:hypothetical protein